MLSEQEWQKEYEHTAETKRVKSGDDEIAAVTKSPAMKALLKRNRKEAEHFADVSQDAMTLLDKYEKLLPLERSRGIGLTDKMKAVATELRTVLSSGPLMFQGLIREVKDVTLQRIRHQTKPFIAYIEEMVGDNSRLAGRVKELVADLEACCTAYFERRGGTVMAVPVAQEGTRPQREGDFLDAEVVEDNSIGQLAVASRAD